MRIVVSLLLCASLLGACQLSENSKGKPAGKANHLIDETSPYLLQHAHNPVDWYPWGEEALEKARKENKLLLVSVGYASCHWCHVMEHESFEDSTVAALMNTYFVAVKVDREERPDIDKIYMDACQLASGGGCGWPLNAFALPDGKPFWAGTYFPKEQWMNILERFRELWQTEPASIHEYARQLTEGVGQNVPLIDQSPNGQLAVTFLQEVTSKIMREVDFEKGGIKGNPKFPTPGTFDYLLADAFLFQNEGAAQAVHAALQNMARGGIYDHLEGGFARYSTDSEWKVPHFEKMLYDNGQLVSLYARAHRATPNPVYQNVIRQTLAFVERYWLSPEGGFYSSFDADSEGEEGTFYVWTFSELESAIKDKMEFSIFREYYSITEKGNWEKGTNILYNEKPIEEISAMHKMPGSAIEGVLEKSRNTLLDRRNDRSRPALDDKILTSWNALMLMGYIDAFHALGDEHYLDVARRNARFLQEKMMAPDGKLWRNHKKGLSTINAFLDDYALLSLAFVELYQATFEEFWLQQAQILVEYALEHFEDTENSLLFYTSDLDPPLVIRQKELVDNVIPGSNAVIATVLWKLGHFLYQPDYLDRAKAMVYQVQDLIADNDQPRFFYQWANLYQQMLFEPYEVAIVGETANALRNNLTKHYLPHALFLGGTSEGNLKLLEDKLSEGETLIYVCQNKVCKLPIREPQKALELMPVLRK